MIRIARKVSFEEISEINARIPEFDSYSPEYFATRCKDSDTLSLAARSDDRPAGYLLAYDKFGDGKRFYVWMAGVRPEYRGKGVLTTLMQETELYARKKAYREIWIKTRNTRREMLSFLIKNNFLFIEINSRTPEKENRILLKKNL